MPRTRTLHPATSSAFPAPARALLVSALALALHPALADAQLHRVRGSDLPAEVRDLPLVEIDPPAPSKEMMALVMSGDGNWAHFISELADTLADRGVPVVGLESRAWLSHPRTPEELTRDMTRVLRFYLKRWGTPSILVVGYSRGADFAPFLVNRLPEDLRARVRAIGLFSPTRMASFEFHLMDLLRYTPRSTDLPSIPEVEALPDVPILCVYGRRDSDTLCPLIHDKRVAVLEQDAGHRLHDSGALADLFLRMVRGSAPVRRASPSPGDRGAPGDG